MISKDLLPGIGEARAVEYTNQEIAALKQAVNDANVNGKIPVAITKDDREKILCKSNKATLSSEIQSKKRSCFQITELFG